MEEEGGRGESKYRRTVIRIGRRRSSARGRRRAVDIWLELTRTIDRPPDRARTDCFQRLRCCPHCCAPRSQCFQRPSVDGVWRAKQARHSQLACRHTRQLRRRPTPSPDAGRRTASPTASRRHLPDGGRAAPGAAPDGRTRTRRPRTPAPGRSPTEAGPGQDRSRTNCPRAGPNVG